VSEDQFVDEVEECATCHVRKRRLSLAKYHEGRAKKLARDWDVIRAECDTEHAATISCSGCGVVHEVNHACHIRQACTNCAKSWGGRTKRRLIPTLRGHMRRLKHEWNQGGRKRGDEPYLTMMTLTVRHSSDIAADRERINLGWRRFRAWLWHRVGARPFVLVWEFTPGDDGKGHPHAHVAIPLPFIEYDKCREEWERATDGAGLVLDFSANKKAKGNAKAVSAYLAKYISKGAFSLDENEESADLWCAWISSSWGKRLLSSSRGFWLVPPSLSPCCSARWDLLDARPKSVLEPSEDGASTGSEATGPPVRVEADGGGLSACA